MNDKDEMKLKIAKGYVRVVSLIITPVFALANLFMIVKQSVGSFLNLKDAFHQQVFMEIKDFWDVFALAGFSISNLIVFVVVLILLAMLVLKIVFFVKAFRSESPDNYRSFFALSVVNLLDCSIGFFVFLLSMMFFSGILNKVVSSVFFVMIIAYASVWPLPLAGIPVSDYCRKREEANSVH
ncbi:MAG: hypothetical protein K5988_06275 [Lachnospiraceae bacterium]|nr:hypothetical protein [Lachnospiraceae bacterium]